MQLPDDDETQPLEPGQDGGKGRGIPKPSGPPSCLAEVLIALEIGGVEPFDHTLQYKQEFRALVQKIQEGTQGLVVDRCVSNNLLTCSCFCPVLMREDPRLRLTFCCKHVPQQFPCLNE